MLVIGSALRRGGGHHEGARRLWVRRLGSAAPTPAAAPQVLKQLKFGVGDGRLRYYLYNWRVPDELQPSQVGLVLL